MKGKQSETVGKAGTLRLRRAKRGRLAYGWQSEDAWLTAGKARTLRLRRAKRDAWLTAGKAGTLGLRLAKRGRFAYGWQSGDASLTAGQSGGAWLTPGKARRVRLLDFVDAWSEKRIFSAKRTTMSVTQYFNGLSPSALSP